MLPGLKAGKIRLGPLGIEIGGPVAKQADHDRPIRRVAPAVVGGRGGAGYGSKERKEEAIPRSSRGLRPKCSR